MAVTFGLAIRAIAARQGARVFRAATRDVQSSATGAAKRVDQLNVSTKRLGGTFGLIARSAAGFLGSIAAIAGIRSTVRAIADFDEATNRARVILGLTTQQFKPFEDAFRKAAVQTRFTANEVADFGAALAQAGFRGKALIDVLKPALDLAANGAIELAKAQTIMIGTLKQWQFQSEESTRVANVLTKASFLTAASIDEIAEASRKAAPLAKQVGLSFEETTAITAILTENIRQAARAGTGLRGAMASLLSPSKQMQERLMNAGISMEDMSIIGGRLVPVLELMEKRSLDAGTKVDLLGRESLITGLILEQTGDQFRGLSKELKGLGDFASVTAEKFEDTLAGAFRRLLSAITDAQISLGKEGLLGVMREVVDFTRDVVLALKGQTDGFINSSKSVLLAKEAILAFGAALVSLGSGTVIAGLAGIVLAINPITTAIGLAVAAIVFFRNETIKVGDTTTSIGALVLTIWKAIADVIDASFGILSSSLKATFFLARDIATDIKNIMTLNFKEISLSFSEDFTEALDDVTNAAARATRVTNTLVDNFKKNLRELNKVKPSLTPGEIPDFGGGVPGLGGATPPSQATQATKELTDQQKELTRFTQEFGDTVADSFGKMISGAETAGQALKNLLDALLELIIKQTLLQPLANVISAGLTSTIGGAATIGAFTPNTTFPNAAFARGGVITGPTIGLAGEGGPEAILPLKRGPSGDLGIESSGSNTVINMNVFTPDANSFRRSRKQIFNDVRKTAARLA